MDDNIQQMVAQLEKRGVGVMIGCNHIGWQISTSSGEELIRYISARDVLAFLSGILCATTMTKQPSI